MIHFKYEVTDRLKCKHGKRHAQCHTKHNAIGEATLILDKLNFTTRNITRHQERTFSLRERIGTYKNHKWVCRSNKKISNTKGKHLRKNLDKKMPNHS